MSLLGFKLLLHLFCVCVFMHMHGCTCHRASGDDRIYTIKELTDFMESAVTH